MKTQAYSSPEPSQASSGLQAGPPAFAREQQLVDALVTDLLAPAVARMGDLDGVLHRLKTTVVQQFRGAEIPMNVVARHLGRSERSIYRLDQEGPSPPGPGARLLQQILLYFHQCAGPMPAGACVRYLQRQDPSVSPLEVMELLELYASLGHLRRISVDDRGTRSIRYQTPDQTEAADSGTRCRPAPAGPPPARELIPRDMSGSGDSVDDPDAANPRPLETLLSLLLAEARQEPEASLLTIRGRLTRDQLAEALTDIHAYASTRLDRARAHSTSETDDGTVEACAMLLVGSAVPLRVRRGGREYRRTYRKLRAVRARG